MIRSELDVLLEKVQDLALRDELRAQIERLKQRRSFGLVFEQHLPERVRRTLGASIVDPHGDYLADARAKLQALAAFAEQFGDRFVRIESIAKVDDGTLRVLDLGDAAVRAAVLAFQGGKVTPLYQSEFARPYP